jgi:outer membrane cobalamin receptor
LQLFSSYNYSQGVSGKITNFDGIGLDKVAIYWRGSMDTTYSQKDGSYYIIKNSTYKTLIYSKPGYLVESLEVGGRETWNIQLMEDQVLPSVNITALSSASKFTDDVAKVEQLGIREIQRAACCSLAGCFSTNSNVDANTTNVITDAKELRILGLAGVYNQILIEGMPLIQGLTLPYGPSSYPGTMIEKIFISKGANSVLQGYENISGQINIDFHNVETAPKLFFNAFANSFGETQYNVNHMFKGRKSSNLTTFHLTTPAMIIDRDGDDFRDIVGTNRIAIFNRWQYRTLEDDRFSTSFAIRGLKEDRIGGQTNYKYADDKFSDKVYGQYVDIKHVEAYSKTNYQVNNRHAIILLTGAFIHDQNAVFGVKFMDGFQKYWNNSLYWDTYFGKSQHNIKFGYSNRINRLIETITFEKEILGLDYNGVYRTNYDVHGFFTEGKFNLNKCTILAGTRVDHHASYGWKFSPRILARWNVSDQSDIRISIGKGFRRVHLFSENQNILASNRKLILNNDLAPEEAWNMGANIIKYIFWGTQKITISGDIYQTYFLNQVFPEYDRVVNTIIVDNFFGRSITNSFQAEVKWEFTQLFDIKTSYNYLDAYRIKDEQKINLPFVSKNKWIANTSYRSRDDHWQFDMTYKYHGSRTLPDTRSYPIEFQMENISPSFSTLDLQFTRRWAHFQIYGGVENITDTRQEFPILGYQKPFGAFFDPSFNWGPTKGREYFLGIRYQIDQKKG